jgi:hypothetical protein
MSGSGDLVDDVDAEPVLQWRCGQGVSVNGQYDSRTDAGDVSEVDPQRWWFLHGMEPSSNSGQDAAQPATDPVAKNLLAAEQGGHLQSAGRPVLGEFDVVDLADRFSGGIDDLSVQQVEVEPKWIWSIGHWPTPVTIINGIAAIATITMMTR